MSTTTSILALVMIFLGGITTFALIQCLIHIEKIPVTAIMFLALVAFIARIKEIITGITAWSPMVGTAIVSIIGPIVLSAFILACVAFVRIIVLVTRRVRHRREQRAAEAATATTTATPPPPAPPQDLFPPLHTRPTRMPTPRVPPKPPTPPSRRPETAPTIPDVPGLDGHRRKYVEWCGKRISDAERVVAARREEAERQLTTATQELFHQGRLHADAERRVAWLEELRRRRTDAAGADFDALAALPVVARAEPTEYGWCVVTTGIRVADGERLVDLGKYEIHIGLTGCVRIFNQSHRPKADGTTWDHPWVRDGEPVLPPAIRLRIIRAAAASKYAEAIATITEFLAGDGAARGLIPLTHWPRVGLKEVHDELRRLVP